MYKQCSTEVDLCISSMKLSVVWLAAKHAVIISHTQTTNTHCSLQLWSIFPHEYFSNLITSLLAHCLVNKNTI